MIPKLTLDWNWQIRQMQQGMFAIVPLLNADTKIKPGSLDRACKDLTLIFSAACPATVSAKNWQGLFWQNH